jgi:uncharacterized repeat protein (TIGR03803 family)
VLYSFTGGSDGDFPGWGGLVFDKTNNLYGATVLGGKYGEGTIFDLRPNLDGTWTESVLHQFTRQKRRGHPRHHTDIRCGGESLRDRSKRRRLCMWHGLQNDARLQQSLDFPRDSPIQTRARLRPLGRLYSRRGRRSLRHDSQR